MQAVAPELAGEPSPPPLTRSPEGLRRLDAWLLLPPGDRAELLGGLGLAGRLDRFRGAPGDGVGGWWLSQDFDMFLGGQGLRPDLVGWRVDRHPRPPQKVNLGDKHLGAYVTAPDWVCEVLSPSTRQRDAEEGLKWRAYHEAGVSLDWLVDLVRDQRLTP